MLEMRLTSSIIMEKDQHVNMQVYKFDILAEGLFS